MRTLESFCLCVSVWLCLFVRACVGTFVRKWVCVSDRACVWTSERARACECVCVCVCVCGGWGVGWVNRGDRLCLWERACVRVYVVKMLFCGHFLWGQTVVIVDLVHEILIVIHYSIFKWNAGRLRKTFRPCGKLIADGYTLYCHLMLLNDINQQKHTTLSVRNPFEIIDIA